MQHCPDCGAENRKYEDTKKLIINMMVGRKTFLYIIALIIAMLLSQAIAKTVRRQRQ